MPDSRPPRRRVLGGLQIQSSTNAALWFEVFPPEHGQEAFGNHYESALNVLEAPHEYGVAYERRRDLLRNTSIGVRGSVTRLFEVEANGRFIVGLGAASASETGIQLLRPWGVPYLPGSSLKGIASAAAHLRGGAWASPKQAGGTPGEHHEALFGSVDRAGCVVFHDAWWVPTNTKLPLALDVMTPHHQDYNGAKRGTDGDVIPPLDTDSPTPVSFLTSTGKYLVAMTGPADWLELAWKLLSEALEHHGVGAKTAAGYGCFTLVSELEDPEVVYRRERMEKLERYVERPPDAGTRQQCVDDLSAAREALGDAAVGDVLKRIATGEAKSWRKWLRDDKRVERLGWLADAAFGAHADQAEATQVQTEVVAMARAWFEKCVSPDLKGKKAAKAKKTRHVFWVDSHGHESWAKFDSDLHGKLERYLVGTTKQTPKPVIITLRGEAVVSMLPAEAE